MSNFTVDIEKQLTSLGKEIQQFVEKLVPVEQTERDFTPVCDVVEGDKLFKILMDLPGMQKKNLNISLKDRVLTIEGERELFLEDDEHLKRGERKQGRFIRSFAIPKFADVNTIDASFKNGVLKIEIAKIDDGDDDSSSIPIK
ncbi:MAG: Hsp20/alpha crystallin family protein [Balneolaceae bacterium]